MSGHDRSQIVALGFSPACRPERPRSDFPIVSISNRRQIGFFLARNFSPQRLRLLPIFRQLPTFRLQELISEVAQPSCLHVIGLYEVDSAAIPNRACISASDQVGTVVAIDSGALTRDRWLEEG